MFTLYFHSYFQWNRYVTHKFDSTNNFVFKKIGKTNVCTNLSKIEQLEINVLFEKAAFNAITDAIVNDEQNLNFILKKLMYVCLIFISFNIIFRLVVLTQRNAMKTGSINALKPYVLKTGKLIQTLWIARKKSARKRFYLSPTLALWKYSSVLESMGQLVVALSERFH